MNNKHFRNAVIASIIFHLLLILLMLAAQKFLPTENNGASPIEVFIQQPNGGWQIADITNSLNDKKPDNPKYLGTQNQSVTEETVSTRHDRGTGGKVSGKRAPDKEQTAEKEKHPQRQKEAADIKNLYDFDKKLFAKKMPKASDNNAITNSSSRGEGGMPEDFYPNYKVGVHTYLNVLRYPDVEYFVRLKRIFKMTWNPVAALQQDMQGTSVSKGNVSVVLAVTVDKMGSLSELFVLRSSGLGHYDNEALRTIRASSPFSAPPDKFLEKDGVLRMSWTFIVYM